MSGDSITSLKMANFQPLNLQDLEYTKKILEPFENIVVERFDNSGSSTSSNRSIFVLIAIALVLIINFPKVREKAGLNEYILWLISAVILFGVLY